MKKSYREENTFEIRKACAQAVKQKIPDRLPIIVEPAQMRTNRISLPGLQTEDGRNLIKFLPPKHYTVGDFICTLRRRLKLDSSQALILFTNHETQPPTLPPVAQPLNDVYRLYHDTDEFLYFQYCGESAFGSCSV